MLVDVVPLRENGMKREREDVLAAAPLRGVLMVGRPPCSTNYKHRLYAGLADAEGRWLLPVLEPAVVHAISSRGMLIRGVEHIPVTVSKYIQFPQAWWCRLAA